VKEKKKGQISEYKVKQNKITNHQPEMTPFAPKMILLLPTPRRARLLLGSSAQGVSLTLSLGFELVDLPFKITD
jgi:hypothetical protein